MFNKKNVETRLKNISEAQRVIFSIACAKSVLPLVHARLHKSALLLRNVLEQCEQSAVSGTELLTLRNQAESVVPDSEDNQSAESAIPAGEATLAALQTIKEPTSENALSAAVLAYTAVEMNEYLKQESPDCRSTTKAQLEAELNAIGNTKPIKDIEEFIEMTLKRLEKAP